MFHSRRIGQSEMATASPIPQVSTPAPAVLVTPVKPAPPNKVTNKKTPKAKAKTGRAIKPKIAAVGTHPPYGDMYVPISFIMNPKSQF